MAKVYFSSRLQAKIGDQSRTGQTQRRSGQALLEFAAVIVVLLLLCMGIVQYGVIYNSTVALNSITRDATRFAARNGAVTTVDVRGTMVATDTAIRNHVREVATGTFIDPADLPDARIDINPVAASRLPGNPVTVTLRYDMTRKFFLPRSFPGLAGFNQNYLTSFTMLTQSPPPAPAPGP